MARDKHSEKVSRKGARGDLSDGWKSLNERQKTYLLEIYRQDQIHERYQKQTYNQGNYNHTPAHEWRRIEYADTIAGHTRLKQAIVDAGLCDPGTGSTFKALASRGLIEVIGNFRGGAVYVWLTAKGRKLVRDAQGIQAPKALKTGQLREWHWRALCLAYAAGEQGVPEAGLGYGRIGWPTWLRLRDYKIGGVEYPLAVQRNGMSITPFGKAYYDRTFSFYHEWYPDVAAPTPETEVDPFDPFTEVVQDHQTCRACRGEYRIAVTRTYQQSPKGSWSVELSSQRTPGRVISPYREIEQCICQESDIESLCAPLGALLDQLEGWQLHFPYHHGYGDLDAFIGGVRTGREKRWYEPSLVQEKLLPRPRQPERQDERNVMKDGDLCYCVNRGIGRGAMYVLGELNLQPVALTRRQGEAAQ